LNFLLISSPGKKAALTGKGKGKAAAAGAAETEQLSGPSKEELRATITDILKKVDFNVVCFFSIFASLLVSQSEMCTSHQQTCFVLFQATFSDILKKLGNKRVFLSVSHCMSQLSTISDEDEQIL
jgi:hypothetical protein